jgi:rhodanese-related sulfurtransferase
LVRFETDALIALLLIPGWQWARLKKCSGISASEWLYFMKSSLPDNRKAVSYMKLRETMRKCFSHTIGLLTPKEKNMTTTRSLILEVPAAAPQHSHDFMLAKLAYHTDAWDVAEDLKNRIAEIVVIDARSEAFYAAGHIPGAISFPHRLMTEEGTAHLDRSKTYVVYCDGIGCNASTKGACKLAGFGFKVKELLGGLDFWKRDQHPVASGTEPGSLAPDTPSIECGCA